MLCDICRAPQSSARSSLHQLTPNKVGVFIVFSDGSQGEPESSVGILVTDEEMHRIPKVEVELGPKREGLA